MVNSNLANAIKKSKVVGIIVSILLVIGGIVILTKPLKSEIVMMWTLLAILLVNGIFRIFRYCTLPKENRNGWILADGIISSVLAILILIDIIQAPLSSTFVLIGTMGYFIGFYEIFVGITQICSSGAVKEAGGSSGWVIFMGILNILCGLFVSVHPFMGTFALELIFGIYAIVFGIIMFIECICMKKGE